jgi:hypothetical protein
MPESPGDLAECSELRAAAAAAAVRVLGPCFDAASVKFAANTLMQLQRTLELIIPASTIVEYRVFGDTLQGAAAIATTACNNSCYFLSSNWEVKCRAALDAEVAPFRLDRFPGYLQKLVAFCEAKAPRVRPRVCEDVAAFLDDALKPSSQYVTLVYTPKGLCATPPTVQIEVDSRRLIGLVLGMLSAGFETQSRIEYATALAVIADTAFADGVQETEACHVERVALTRRLTTIDRAERRLLQLKDPELPLETEELLDATVRRLLPAVPDVAFSVGPSKCTFKVNGQTPDGLIFMGGQRHNFQLTTCRPDGGSLGGGGLNPTAVMRTGDRTIAVPLIDNGNGTYGGSIKLSPRWGAHRHRMKFVCTVQVCGVNVAGSPVEVTVRPPK